MTTIIEIIPPVVASAISALFYIGTKNPVMRTFFLFMSFFGLLYTAYLVKDVSSVGFSFYVSMIIFSLVLFAIFLIKLLGVKRG